MSNAQLHWGGAHSEREREGGRKNWTCMVPTHPSTHTLQIKYKSTYIKLLLLQCIHLFFLIPLSPSFTWNISLGQYCTCLSQQLTTYKQCVRFGSLPSTFIIIILLLYPCHNCANFTNKFTHFFIFTSRIR